MPEIIEVIGDRPFPMKESIKNYLAEMEKRRQDEEAEAASKKEEDAAEQDVE